MKTISKLEIIAALGETTSALSLRKKELIDKLFEIQVEAEKEISRLKENSLINIEEWDVSYLKCRYNSYMLYDGSVIEYNKGCYDGGDYNYWVPATDYKKLVEFCEKSTEIIKGMQEELAEKLDKLEQLTSK